MAATVLKKKEGAKSEDKPRIAKPRLSEVETPVKPADRDGDRFGVSAGLRLNEYFCKVLEENENPKKGHKDDEQLMQMFLAEFPNKHNKNILYNVREIRWRYNTGRLTPDTDGNLIPPEIQSLQYDADGNVKEKRKTLTGMSAEEAAMKLEDRQNLERERRLEEDTALAKLQERLEKNTARITTRRETWEKKNGELPDVEEEAPKEKSEKKKLKKVK